MTTVINYLNDCYVEKRFSSISLTLEDRTGPMDRSYGKIYLGCITGMIFHGEEGS